MIVYIILHGIWLKALKKRSTRVVLRIIGNNIKVYLNDHFNYFFSSNGQKRDVNYLKQP